MRRPRLVAPLLVAAVAFAACGVPQDNAPRVLAAADQPVDLQATSTTSPGGQCEEGSASVSVFFLTEEEEDAAPRLRRVFRCVPSVDVEVAINELLLGPQQAESQLDTAIPSDTQLISATVGPDEVLTVDLGPPGGGITGIQAEQQLAAFAQIVYTGLAVSSRVQGVRFLVNGQPLPALTPAGETTEPVEQADYEQFAPG